MIEPILGLLCMAIIVHHWHVYTTKRGGRGEVQIDHLTLSSKQQMLTRWWKNAGPASQTLGQYYTIIG